MDKRIVRERFVTTLDPERTKDLKVMAAKEGKYVNELLEEMIEDKKKKVK